MKYYLFLIPILFFLFKGQAQNTERKYVQAYCYLNKCENIKELHKKGCKYPNLFPLNVSDSTYSISLFGFDKIEIESFFNIVDLKDYTWDKFDKQNYSKPKYNRFKNLFVDNKNSNIYLFFSAPYKGTLIVEIFSNVYNVKEINYNKLAAFNNGLKCLFIFDEDDNIKEVHKSLMNYD